MRIDFYVKSLILGGKNVGNKLNVLIALGEIHSWPTGRMTPVDVHRDVGK